MASNVIYFFGDISIVNISSFSGNAKLGNSQQSSTAVISAIGNLIIVENILAKDNLGDKGVFNMKDSQNLFFQGKNINDSFSKFNYR